MEISIVLGASENEERYANRAVKQLRAHGHAVLAVGARPGRINDVPILTDIPERTRAHTVTLYLNPVRQAAWQQRILDLSPTRIIFNPGAENPAFARAAEAQGVEVVEGCTLVMLGTGQY